MKDITYYEKTEDFLNLNLQKNTKYLLLVAEHTSFSLDEIQKKEINFIGAIVTQVVYNENSFDKGLLLIELDDESKTFLIKDIQNFKIDKDQLASNNSFTLIIDGLSSHITPFLESIFNTLPSNSQIIGGGAGKLTLEQEPVIFSNEGIFEDAALLIASTSELTVGVENSWEYLEGPFIVSSSNKNILKSLDFENSFEVYKRIVEKDSGKVFTKDNFFELSKSYPLGIIKHDNEIIVRDPIAKDENGYMILVGDLEQNSTINILKGNKQSLINSSKNTILKIKEKKKLNEISNIIVFDCISRSIFLDNDFNLELKSLKNNIEDKKLFGALTLGEIANNGNEYINFYNKTCVVGALC
jgi:hypothetical protein